MSFAEISAQLQRVLDVAGEAVRALHQAADDADHCTNLIAEATAGTTQESEAAAVIANFDVVRTGAIEQREALACALHLRRPGRLRGPGAERPRA